MTKPQRHGSLPPGSVATLPVRAVEALQDGRFKDAIELFKQLLRQEPSPEWKDSLADAYAGRARGLAAKGMFKEAAIVLENTLNADKLLREPALYVSCLIRDNQQAKAAAYLFHCASRNALPASLEERAAALSLTLAQLPPATGPLPPEAARWRDLASAAREALGAWIEGAPPATVDAHLARISLRSAFRPVRLLLKCLITQPVDLARTRQVLDSITPASAFFPFRTAVEAAISGGATLDADSWHRLNAAQQGFVAETGGLSPAAIQSLGRLSEAARGGSGSLFAWLLKQSDLPPAELRSACLNLLPKHPDRIGQFEKTFGALTPEERLRIQALSAEAGGKWAQAEAAWNKLAGTWRTADDRSARVAAGVIYRHLARLSREHDDITGNDTSDPQIFYLEHSSEVDPDYLPTVLERIAYYRRESLDKEWHQLADEAVQRFADDSQILRIAMESSVARQAYKKATGFARRLLSIDPINTGVRRQMIELQVAHARKQMRSKRPDLAAKELAVAAEWDRPDAPDALLRIARGLVALGHGEAGDAQSWLQAGAELSGGGVAGAFRVVLEAELMKCSADALRGLHAALDQEMRMPPTRPAVLSVVTALRQPATGRDKTILQTLMIKLHPWLVQGAAIAWTEEEFQVLAETFTRLEGFSLLRDYAAAARKREPGNPEWRFQQIVARTRGNSDAMTFEEADEVNDILQAAAGRKDFHACTRIGRFVENEQSPPSRRSRPGRYRDEPNLNFDAEDLSEMLAMFVEAMPREAAERIRRLAHEQGRDAAIADTNNDFRDSPIAGLLPDPVLRKLCRDTVDHALAGAAARKGRF